MLERLKKKIPIERIWQTVNLNLRISSGRRANYLKKHGRTCELANAKNPSLSEAYFIWKQHHGCLKCLVPDA